MFSTSWPDLILINLDIGIATITNPPALLNTVPAETIGGPSQAPQSCNFCVLVADVAGLVWYSEIFLNTAATAVVGIGVGNGTQPRTTRTSIIQNEAQITFNPAEVADATGPAALTAVQFEPSITISGATLTSPTAYNVFTGYTITSAYLSEGNCVTTTQTRDLSVAYSEILSTSSGRIYINEEGEQSFIDFLGFTTCSEGGESVVPTVLAQVSNVTTSTTMFFSGGALAAATSLAPTTNPTTKLPVRTTTLTDVLTTLTATLSGSSTITPPPGSARIPEIVLGNSTLTPNKYPVPLPILPGNNSFPAPTASGVGNGSGVGTIGTGPSITPYLGDAPSWRSGSSLWGCGLLAFVVLIGWIL
ncbi:MAG: hypothetical protein Q9214_003910 [Letrouitia sp. 1 TL-2023]